MAEVTVKQLAEVVGVPIEKLLQQMSDAGLKHQQMDQSVSDVEKQQLLSFLKQSHGVVGSDRKITLQRKSLSTIKVAGAQGKKTVSVEVRKKRTYIQRGAQQEEPVEPIVDAPDVVAVPETPVVPESLPVEAAPIVQTEVSAQDQQIESDVDGATNKRSDAVDRGKKSKTVPKSIPKLKTDVNVKKKLAGTLPNDDAKPEDQARRKADEQARREADEKARKKTLEDAQRVAAELATRGGVEPPIDGESLESEPEEEDVLVKQAFEASFEEEEKRQKRTRKSIKHKMRVAKKLAEEHGFTQPTAPMVREVRVGETISVPDLANQMSVKAVEVIKQLMKMGVPAHVNQFIEQDTAILVIEELGHKYQLLKENTLEHALTEHLEQKDSRALLARAPVVTIMGHVDHGKTSLLDYIRRTKVASGEAGGITQHIGAYHVETEKGAITFLDTPGHAAFSAMRARGAQCTDIVVLVVAADDGMMPQTEEAIDHARSAGVPIVVAINKIDKPQGDAERVKNELATRKDLAPEEWGGETLFIPVSALTGQGVDALLDAILLQAELMELTAPPEGFAQGVVIESRLDKGRGPVVTLLVQQGQLHIGDLVLAGPHFGRVRAMSNAYGRAIETAGPSIPVEILGLAGVPDSGNEFVVLEDERRAREVAGERERRHRLHQLVRPTMVNMDNLFESIAAKQVSMINIVLKTDVRGSLEAVQAALLTLGNDEVKINIVSSGVGAITESDANLAVTTRSIVVGFNVRADASAKKICKDEGVDIRYYSIIYNVIDDMRDALSGLLQPERREKILGVADVREVFRSSKFGAAAGCLVQEGSLFRKHRIRVLRNDVVIYEGELESLRRFKDDVGEVKSGMECGVAVKGYGDVKIGDKIEAFEVSEISRSL
jgi:translation initiation factor IF-2